MSALCFFIYLTLCVWTHFPLTSVIDKQREREKHRTKLASVLRQTTSHVGGNWRTRRNPTHTRREHAENTQNNQFLDYYSTYNRWHSSYHRHQTCFNITASGTESKQTVTVDQFYLQNIPCGQLAPGHHVGEPCCKVSGAFMWSHQQTVYYRHFGASSQQMAPWATTYMAQAKGGSNSVFLFLSEWTLMTRTAKDRANFQGENLIALFRASDEM